MTQTSSYSPFVSCTSLVDFQQNLTHKIGLAWQLQTNSFQYDKVEIYRYIGNYMESKNPDDINETNAKLIYSAKQNVDIEDKPNGTTTVERYFPVTSTTTESTNIVGITSYIDDFNLISPTLNDLDYFHSLTGVPNNITVINDIGFTRRVLYYVLKTYIRGAPDVAPYLLTPDCKSKAFVNHATKTQVRHDYLHYEGDEIWSSKEFEAGDSGAGISRTAVDIKRLFMDSSQQGPRGDGGYAWVSDRSSGKAFQHNLRDGCKQKVWSSPFPYISAVTQYTTGMRGFGIGIDPQTGDCIAGPGANSSSYWSPSVGIFRFDISKPNKKLIPIVELDGQNTAYGIIPLLGYDSKMLVTSWGYQNTPFILNIDDGSIIYPTNTDPVLGYAAAACPNGKGIQKSLPMNSSNAYAYPSGSQVVIINPTDCSWFRLNLNTNGIMATGSRVTVDQYDTFPNTIINGNSDTRAIAKNYFTIFAESEFGVYVPNDSDSSSDCQINWAIDFPKGVQKLFTTAGFDGENNIWGLVNRDKTKMYRTAHDRVLGDSTDDSLVYPQGGESRYPSVHLRDWSFSVTNTKEIEWFLTRNHGVSTLDVINGVDLTLIQEIPGNASTLDDTKSEDWLGTGNQTAYSAWWSMVEEKMLRKHYAGSYKTVDYFKVYDDAGTQQGSVRKWGIRMDVTDMRVAYNSAYGGFGAKNHDKYYETKSDDWMPKVIARIKAWSAAFADYDTAYPTLTSSSTRNALIAGNLAGLKVHPFYSIANNYTPTSVYVNNSLTTTQRDTLTRYADSMKYVNFKNLVVKNLYMYSDFTGKSTLGTVQPTPYNRDIIHPETATPSISLLVSGYQGGGFNDVPEYCYPWKNTLPISMSSFFGGVTGYDDFITTYMLSTNMGSYLLTSFKLSTDDFSSYLNDSNPESFRNPEVIKNTEYNNSNVYETMEYFDYTYHSPSMMGLYYLPSGNTEVSEYINPVNPNGIFNAKSVVDVINLYSYASSASAVGGSSINLYASTNVMVLERWPEPRFYINATDSVPDRLARFSNNVWGLDRFDKASSIYKESNTKDALRYDITYGVDPINIGLEDKSISRTWPISSWMLTISTDNTRLGWSSKSFTVTSSEALNVPQDQQNIFQPISSLQLKYGNYGIVMNVQASSTMTSSDRPFIQYVQVAEFEPFANFWAISAKTVSDMYSATNTSISGQLIDISPNVHNGSIVVDGITYPIVSGYAPNLTVYFQDSSESHTFPISSYHWNFGDPFNEGPQDITNLASNYYTISNTVLASGDFDSANWVTTKQGHTAVHTYIMPGTYDVTLTVRASTTSTSDICARYVGNIDDDKKFYVYVEEIQPQCNNGIYGSVSSTSGFTTAASGINGQSSLTSYFMASSIIAGSFPICRIDWDFGDGEVQTITRIPLTQSTSQGLQVINLSAYSYDLNDPRNIVVPHVYTNQTQAYQTYTINISAYACNTNSVLYCSRSDLVWVAPEVIEDITETKNLIGSRFDDNGNLIYILEGENNNTTHTVVLSGELNNV